MKFQYRMNLTALLVTILGSRNKNKHSEFWYLTSQWYLLYKFRLKKDKPWVLLSKFRCGTILMHFLLLICDKFTRAQLAHQIFSIKNMNIFLNKSIYIMEKSHIFAKFFKIKSQKSAILDCAALKDFQKRSSTKF
jgi:hypothetical protein